MFPFIVHQLARADPHCGSTNIFKDAAAAWDAEAQEWSLASVHDHETCEDCGREGDYMAERRALPESEGRDVA